MTKEKAKKTAVRCLRCDRISYVEIVAQCRHCGSYAVKILKKKNPK